MRDNISPPAIIDDASAIFGQVQQAQGLAAARNKAIRDADRQSKMDAWQDPDAMIERRLVNELAAHRSLVAMKNAGQCAPDIDMPLPPRESLPKHMRDQQPSTIRKMLAAEDNHWRAKLDIHKHESAKKMEQANTHRLRHPEMFGLDDSFARRKAGNISFINAVRGQKIGWLDKLKSLNDSAQPSKLRKLVNRLWG